MANSLKRVHRLIFMTLVIALMLTIVTSAVERSVTSELRAGYYRETSMLLSDSGKAKLSGEVTTGIVEYKLYAHPTTSTTVCVYAHPSSLTGPDSMNTGFINYGYYVYTGYVERRNMTGGINATVTVSTK